MIEETDIVDAAVVGGGIVGLAAALAVAAAGHRVAVVERELPARRRGELGYDIRTVALTATAVDFLDRLDGIDKRRLAAIETMRVWEHDGASSLRFDRAQDGVAPAEATATPSRVLAWVAENSDLVMRLWQAARTRVAMVAPASVTALVPASDCVTLVCRREGDGGERLLRTRLAIAADGADSRLRELAGATIRREPQPTSGAQCAVATVVRTRCPHRNTAWQRFGATGPVALLPLVEECSMAVIWSVAESVGARLRDLNDDQFIAALDKETENACGGIEAVDARLAFPLRQTLASDLNPMPRVILAGDAARTLHPLAGQGVNIGLEDVRAIAAEAGIRRDDLGATERWRGYATQRRRRSKLMLALMRGLLSAYCGSFASNPWLRLARNSAVRCIDSSAAAKAQLLREAAGLGPLASW